MADEKVSALLVDVGVSMGDHGETITRAVDLTETEESVVRGLLDRLIKSSSHWRLRKYENHVVLRWVEPVDTDLPEAPASPTNDPPF